jgi:hypothetical protein
MTDATIITNRPSSGRVPARAPTVIHAAAERLRCTLDAEPTGAGARAMAGVRAAREVYDSALNRAPDDSDAAIADALRRMVREALHVLGADALRELRAATLAGRQVRRLREMSCDAMQHGSLAPAIAADVIAAAGPAALVDALTVRAGIDVHWHDDVDELIRTQHCSRHNVFCCPDCPDEPDPPIAPVRRVSMNG